MFNSSFVPPALLGIVGLNPLEIIISGGVTLGFLAVIGAIIYSAIKVARLQPMDVCPHCGAKLRGH